MRNLTACFYLNNILPLLSSYCVSSTFVFNKVRVVFAKVWVLGVTSRATIVFDSSRSVVTFSKPPACWNLLNMANERVDVDIWTGFSASRWSFSVFTPWPYVWTKEVKVESESVPGISLYSTFRRLRGYWFSICSLYYGTFWLSLFSKTSAWLELKYSSYGFSMTF